MTDLDDLCTDRPSDRFDHHMERLEGRDLMPPRKKSPLLTKPDPGTTPMDQFIYEVFAHADIGEDYKVLFGWLAGVRSREEMLDQNPDLRGIV